MGGGTRSAVGRALLAAALCSGCAVADLGLPSPPPRATAVPTPTPVPVPTLADAVLLRPEQMILPDAEFPLAGYGVENDERRGTSGWVRTWRGTDAFSWVRVTVTVLGPATGSRSGIAATTCDWTFTPVAAVGAAEITAPVVGDGAKACGYDFPGAPVGALVYTTGTRNVLVSVGVYRRTASQAAAAAFAASLADYQLWIVDRVAPLTGAALRATPKVALPGVAAVVTPAPTARTAAPAPTAAPVPPTPAPTATPFVVTPTPSPAPSVALRNVPCGSRVDSTVTSAALPLTTTYVCYDVSGATGSAILASVDSRSPVASADDPPGYTSIALTDSQMRLHVEYGEVGGTCRTTSVSGTFTITFTYPRWVPPASPDPALVAKWNTWLAGLQVHEDGHRDRALVWFNDAVARIRAISVASCADFSAAYNAVQDQAEAASKKSQADYEASTNHGMTQRSGLP